MGPHVENIHSPTISWSSRIAYEYKSVSSEKVGVGKCIRPPRRSGSFPLSSQRVISALVPLSSQRIVSALVTAVLVTTGHSRARHTGSFQLSSQRFSSQRVISALGTAGRISSRHSGSRHSGSFPLSSQRTISAQEGAVWVPPTLTGCEI